MGSGESALATATSAVAAAWFPAVEGEGPGEPRRRREAVDAGREREPAEVGAGERGAAGQPGGVVVGGREGSLRRHRGAVGNVDGASGHDPGREADDGGAGPHAHVTGDRG